MGVAGPYGALAGLAGPSAAEWSLFCPGIGIAADSCAGLIALFDRPAVDAAWLAMAGENTESAAGTDVSGAGPDTTPASAGAAWTIGAGGVAGVLSQAPSASAPRQAAITAGDGFMVFPSG